jgi:type IV pilus assembly protein PilB
MSPKNLAADGALLKFAVRAGLLTGDVAQSAEAELAKGTQTAIDWLEGRQIITEEALAQLLAKEFHLPCVNLAAEALNPTVTKLVKEDLATRHGIVALRAPERNLVIAMANPLDREAIRTVEFATGRRVHVEVATQTGIRDALNHAYHLDEALSSYLQGIPMEGEAPVTETSTERSDIKGLMEESSQAPIVKLLNVLLVDGIRNGASDIHIEPSHAEVRVRYRVDGILEESFRLPRWIQDPLTARCKVLAKLDITERRVPQDGRINMRYRDSDIDLRVSSLPTQFGEKVTMRVLDASGAPAGLDDRGFSERDLTAIRQAIARPEGMILVTGPTGSGKSTTLYAMLAEMISPTTNIVTIENPIEYQLRGVNQVQINDKQGLTFASTLRSILRQDPDVILVGEIRDSETAEIALRAAQTGHLVLSTLHTNDSVSTIARLIDLGIEPFMLASSLHLIMAQRLVRRTCQRCAEPYEPDPAALRTLQIDGNARQFMRGRGCNACRKSGYAGRIGVFEVLSVTRPLAALIESKASEATLRAQAREDGMKLLAECAASRVLEGTTTPEEVLVVVDVETDAAHCPTCDRVVEENFALCPHCATPLRCTCSSCGMQLQKEWQLCPYCGTTSKHGGSAVSVVPPSSGPPAIHPPPAVPLAIGDSTTTRRYRALVVDDQPDMRRLVSHTLQYSGLPIATIEAADGFEALSQAQDDPPDLILLDIMMPGMDGFEVCEQLRASVRTAFIPILMLTAKDDAGSRARGFLAGTDDYIGKPFARAELLARVRRLLERTYGASFPRESTAPQDPQKPSEAPARTQLSA